MSMRCFFALLYPCMCPRPQIALETVPHSVTQVKSIHNFRPKELKNHTLSQCSVQMLHPVYQVVYIIAMYPPPPGDSVSIPSTCIEIKGFFSSTSNTIGNNPRKWLGMIQFKVDRLQIILVAKKYIYLRGATVHQ